MHPLEDKMYEAQYALLDALDVYFEKLGNLELCHVEWGMVLAAYRAYWEARAAWCEVEEAAEVKASGGLN